METTMYMSAMTAMSLSVIKALEYDLDPHVHPEHTFVQGQGMVPTGNMNEVRPQEDRCHIVQFPQTWGSTALGFGGMGGSAMTDAPTTIVIGPLGDACVYFAGRLAYHIKRPNRQFGLDMDNHRMKAVKDSHLYEHSSEGY